MTGLRSFLWLIALVAFAVPSLGTRAAPVQTATEQRVDHAAMTDCGEHKPPPPDDCPSRDTAKHLTGDCCPAMGGTVALLPAGALAAIDSLPEPRHASLFRDLTGLAPVKDLPPPRA